MFMTFLNHLISHYILITHTPSDPGETAPQFTNHFSFFRAGKDVPGKPNAVLT